MLHIDKWCRISAIDCTRKDAFPPLFMIRDVGNWGRVSATRNMMLCRRHHRNNVTTAALATEPPICKQRSMVMRVGWTRIGFLVQLSENPGHAE